MIPIGFNTLIKEKSSRSDYTGLLRNTLDFF